MPTTNPDKACPALAILHATMGTRGRKQLLPEHRAPLGDDRTRCGHCGCTLLKGARS